MSVGGRKSENVVESYTSDDFEDTSMSGSGSASNSGLIQKVVKPAATKPASTLKKIEESSDVYEDDDFESLSRSQQQMNQILPVPAKKLPTVVQKTTSQSTVKKENQQTMTNVGKYNYSSDPTSGVQTMKEMSLAR